MDSNSEVKTKKVGVVSHYFGNIGVAAVKLTDILKVGDKVKFVGATTDFEEIVGSMQKDHASVDKAVSGDEVGIKVKDKVRDGDRVYLI